MAHHLTFKPGDTASIKIDGRTVICKIATMDGKKAAVHPVNDRGTLDRAQLVFVDRLTKVEGA